MNRLIHVFNELLVNKQKRECLDLGLIIINIVLAGGNRRWWSGREQILLIKYS